MKSQELESRLDSHIENSNARDPEDYPIMKYLFKPVAVALGGAIGAFVGYHIDQSCFGGSGYTGALVVGIPSLLMCVVGATIPRHGFPNSGSGDGDNEPFE